MYTLTRKHTRTGIHTYTPHIHMHRHTCTHTHTRTHIHIHTHTHKHRQIVHLCNWANRIWCSFHALPVCPFRTQVTMKSDWEKNNAGAIYIVRSAKMPGMTEWPQVYQQAAACECVHHVIKFTLSLCMCAPFIKFILGMCTTLSNLSKACACVHPLSNLS